MTPTSSLDIGFIPRNKEGYADYMVFQALKNVQRTEFGYRPLVYVCSPYSSDTEANVQLARRIGTHAVEAKKIPLAPHLLFRSSLTMRTPTSAN